MPEAGSHIGSYEIVRELGRGGMGVVYQARDQELDRDVAIQVLPELMARDKERVLRFEREAKLLALLNHANIAQIYGFEEHPLETGATHFLVLEYVEGETPAARIQHGFPRHRQHIGYTRDREHSDAGNRRESGLLRNPRAAWNRRDRRAATGSETGTRRRGQAVKAPAGAAVRK